jgi:hypothetical protein
MARFLVAIALTAVACLAASKDRAWQNGRLVDNRDTRYFSTAEINSGVSKDGVKDQYGGIDYSTNSTGAIATVYQNFMFESADGVYLVQVARLRTARQIRVSAISPVKLAVEKSKLWFVDQEGTEYEAHILKQVLKQPTQVAVQQEAPKAPVAAQPEAKPAPVAAVKPADPKPAPAPVVVKTEPAPVKPAPAPVVQPAPVVIAKAVPKPDPVVARPAPAPAPAPAPPPAAAVVPKPAPVVAVKAEPKPQPVAPKPAPKEEPVAPAHVEVAGSHTVKDRAWQSGQLLSTISNQYFVNVNYTTETDGATWNMVQGDDGRVTLVSQAKSYASNSTFDNYVIESQFCAYLVQRWRPKSAPMVRFPGSKPLRFAVEKSKLFVLDDDGKEYETKVVRLVQRDAVDTHTHVVSR